MIKALVNFSSQIAPKTPLLCLMRQQPLFFFSRRAKNSQLILHSPSQIEQMIVRKQQNFAKLQAKPKSWKRGVEGEARYRVSLVGLPNCGKSSIFNCLVGENIAIVDPHRGTTRDRKEFTILEGLVSVIDTPGVEADLLKKGTVSGNTLKQEIFKQTIAAIHESHMILLVVDSKKPVTREQVQFAQYLKAFGKHAKIGLVFNKCDGLFDQGEVIAQSSALGLGQPWTVSAADGSGIIELLNFINDNVPQEMKQSFELKRKAREEKFQELVKKLRADIQKMSADKGFKAGQWETDFRRINPNPADNQDLDGQNFEEFFVRPEEAFSNSRGAEARNPKLKGIIKICLIGRPNVGKSTLINELLGEQKVVVSSIPHTTRDSIRARLEYKERKIELIDTAGINTPNLDKTEEEHLRKVQISTMAHVKQSHVVIYVMDAYSSMVLDDFDLIRSVIKEGRPVVIAVNKWEAVKQPYRYKAKNYLLKQLDKHMGQLHGDPLVYISAKMSFGMDELLNKVIDTYDKWNTRISTGLLNNWLQKFKKLQHMPRDNEHTLKINYLIQARVRPPHFVFFLNSRDLFESHYQRFLLRNMAKQFGMNGVPLRLTLRSTNHRENKWVRPRERKQSAMKQKMEQLKKKYGNLGL